MSAMDTSGLMDGKEFRESLKKYKPTVYVDGQLIESVVDAPSLQPGINAMAVTYDFAHDPAMAPLMLAYRFAPAGSALFYIGMCAGFVLPLATYGPANALIQALTPAHMRSTVTGATMMLINVFAVAIGNLAVGAVSDRLTATGSAVGLTVALVATDVLVACSLWFFWRASRSGDAHLADAVDKNAVPVH